MKITGFSFIKNAIKYQYPIVEALQSILPLCDEVIVAVGDSDDGTRELVASIDQKKVKIIERIIDKKPSLQFSAESLRLTINNEVISVHLLETKFSENISPKNILSTISSLTQEVKTNFKLKDKEKKKILELIEKLNNVLAPLPKRILVKRTLFAKKWTFSLSTPYILKIIEILSGAGIEHSKNNTNSNGTTNKMSI